MELWHETPDAPRAPRRVCAGEWVTLTIGSWPVEPEQSVWVEVGVQHADGHVESQRVPADWRENAGCNSYWRAELGPFADGARVRYRPRGRSRDGDVTGPAGEFVVGPRLYLALLWHQHQPCYRDPSWATPRGSYRLPDVRRHAVRDYYPMAALVAEHPGVHLTINLTPVLLSQIEDYVERGATDRALELTRTPAETLDDVERAELLATFFDANPETQIAPHCRYAELWQRARAAMPFTVQDLRDLQMWANLAWFAQEYRDGEVELVTGEVVSVQRFVRRERGFTAADIEEMLTEQYKIMRAVIPIHRQLQRAGQIEVATTPYFHPVLPLLVDSDCATLDRPGTFLPPRFAHPEDADAQVRLAVDHYERWFGRPPRGMWPAEGAVSQSVVPYFARHGVRWIASDHDVLARSGRWGYRADQPDVLCQPYLATEGDDTVTIVFRDGWLSDHIGFHYQHYADYEQAAREFLEQLHQRYARPLDGPGDRLLLVALDGENAWSAYREDARPFLHALYALLERDREVVTVTVAEYLDGNAARRISPHPPESLARVHDLFTGSWADEAGSAAGVDLGTWIGEPDENDAWALLSRVREDLVRSGATPANAPVAWQALYTAEGSDWFWWLGSDQSSAQEPELDALFHAHLQQVYRALGQAAPPAVAPHTPPATVVWTRTCPVRSIAPAFGCSCAPRSRPAWNSGLAALRRAELSWSWRSYRHRMPACHTTNGCSARSRPTTRWCDCDSCRTTAALHRLELRTYRTSSSSASRPTYRWRAVTPRPCRRSDVRRWCWPEPARPHPRQARSPRVARSLSSWPATAGTSDNASTTVHWSRPSGVVRNSARSGANCTATSCSSTTRSTAPMA